MPSKRTRVSFLDSWVPRMDGGEMKTVDRHHVLVVLKEGNHWVAKFNTWRIRKPFSKKDEAKQAARTLGLKVLHDTIKRLKEL